MDQARSTTAPRRTNDSQIRRAQRGIVAGYIHQLSERHGSHRRPGPSRAVRLRS